VEVSSKLQLKPGPSVAVLNPPPGLIVPEVVAAVTAADADAVVAFVVRQDDLGPAEQAVAAARGNSSRSDQPEVRLDDGLAGGTVEWPAKEGQCCSTV
jgi:hypothetical protein